MNGKSLDLTPQTSEDSSYWVEGNARDIVITDVKSYGSINVKTSFSTADLYGGVSLPDTDFLLSNALFKLKSAPGIHLSVVDNVTIFHGLPLDLSGSPAKSGALSVGAIAAGDPVEDSF